MSSISSVPAVTSPYLAASQSDFGQTVQDFNAIGSALQSGDLTTAQSELTTFQQALQGSLSAPATQPFGKNSQANADYQNLTSSLQSGNLAGAQKAFTSLKNDLNPTQAAHRGHHHHHSSSAMAPAPAATTTSSSTSSSSNSALGSSGGLNVFA